MAPPKKIIARTSYGINQVQICLFQRIGKKWYIEKILMEEAPLDLALAKDRMKKISEELGVPWQTKKLKDAKRKQSIKAQKKVEKAAIIAEELAKKAENRAKRWPVLNFDGSSKGKARPSASAATLEMPDFTIETVTRFLQEADNCVAEYTGLIIGLEKALSMGITKIEIHGDSLVIINQVLGKCRVNTNYFPYYEQVLQLLSSFESYSLNWIPRKKNQLADRAAKKCLKQNCPEPESFGEHYAEQCIQEYIRMYSQEEE